MPDIKLYLAGRNMPDWLSNLKLQNVIVVGEVEDAKTFIESKTISIAPLLSGSGIRIKIIESMALGKAVISTTIGAEGINYTNGHDILIANTPNEFVNAVKILSGDLEKTKEIGAKAKLLIDKHHDSKKIIDRLVQFYDQIF